MHAVLQPRRKTRVVHVGQVPVGGDHPVRVQSMTTTDTRDVDTTVAQITALARAGCEIVRVAVPDAQAAAALASICRQSPLPVIADIHFDGRLAVAAAEAGVAGLRINPGNIGAQLERVVDAARAAAIPIRVGANSGSIPKDILHQCGGPTPEALVEAALRHVRLLEDHGFAAIKISLKSSSVPVTVAAYRRMSTLVDYPLHLGVTEAGTPLRGAVKSALGIGMLLAEGIGDTLRVSLTGDPLREMTVAWEILGALGLRRRGPEIVSCPTCGRTEIDLEGLVDAVEKHLAKIADVFTVAVMGCVVNGPGEAREADIGIAGGRGCGVIFKKGNVVRKVHGESMIPAFLEELDRFLAERRSV